MNRKSTKKKFATKSKMKNRPKQKKIKIERDYLTVFSPRTLPFQELHTDEDSLEQPSELKYVPSTATPHVLAYDLK